MFSPTPIPEPVNPSPRPQPPPDPVTPRDVEAEATRPGECRYSAAYLEALLDFNLLRLIEHGFWILASHGVSESGPSPMVCVACQKLWRCPEIMWAADWILKAKRLGLLDQFGLEVSDDVLAVLVSWGSGVAVLMEAEAVSANG